jgi:nucleotide-binding universal stress UspA family protein
MTNVLATIDDTATAEVVLGAAQVLARTLGSEVRVLHVREGDARTAQAVAARARLPLEIVEGDVTSRILEASAAQSVVVVLGARRLRGGRRPGGHVATAIMVASAVPVLVVPPGVQLSGSGRFERLLLPLEGQDEGADGRAEVVHDLAGAGVEVLAVHVFGPASVPRFWDQSGHAPQSWSAEFLSRWCVEPGADLHLRTGDIAASILHVATCEQADLIIVAWSQDLTSDHARVVRDLLGRSEIPMLLTPAGTP